MKKNKQRVLLFDLEASNLAANFGVLFCVGYKWLGEKKVNIISIRDDKKALSKDPTMDKSVVERFSKVLEEADLLVGHYSTRFDYQYLQTKCLEHELPPMAKVPQVDTWKIAKYCLKLNSNRLETVSRALPYKDEKNAPRKTPIQNKAWIKAVAGHIPSLKEIEYHCKMDILVLEDVYKKIAPFASQHPHIGRMLREKSHEADCPACGSVKTHRRGTSVSGKTKQQRYQCQDCGHWFTDRLQKEKK